MITYAKKTSTFLALTLLLATMVMGGCFRKHIASSPPAQRPAQTAETAQPAPAPAPTVNEETPEVIEETYIVDAPAEETPQQPKVQEGDLDDEPQAATPQTTPAEPMAAATAGAAGTAAAEPVETAKPAETPQPETTTQPAVTNEPVETVDAAPAPMGEMYFVQVGAFSDMENANRVLSRLIADGYKQSKLAKTSSGLYRVQAGAFADMMDAEEALMKLQGDFPKGFILKSTVAE